MSVDAVALVREAYEAWNRDGPRAMLPYASAELQLQDPPQMPDGRTWEGCDAVLARLEEVAGAVGGRWVDLREMRLAGDEVFVAMAWRIDSSPDSAVLGDVFHLVRVRGGKLDRIRVFVTEADALETVD
ncbi:MAG TPA: nuclear transport factor 2 family protein [Solirubrobacterales bacterium]|nr:nuclear transport factor 2 family protein [Solirubrobacterales bacterium]